jgi:uracil-DNA glycosylase
MRVAQARQWTAQDVADSYALWWREAGLHCATSVDAHGWLAPPTAEPQTIDAVAAQSHQRVAEPAPVVPIRPGGMPFMPTDLAGFRAWLAQGEGQPETLWSGPLFLPSEAVDTRLLVITDMPDDEPVGPLMPLAAPAARFLTTMLAAIGLKPEDVAFAPLAMRRAPGGLLDNDIARDLARRMRHYLGLARPRAALILGDKTSRALLAAQATPGPLNLPEINHDGGILPVAALAGPELLMRRPLAKAASWQTLRLLSKVVGEL